MSETHLPVRLWAVVIKSLILFLIVNFLFTLPWADSLGKYSLYNRVVPGLDRFPGTTDLNAFIYSHKVSQPKKPNEYRILMIGDSTVWGVLLENKQTVSGLLSAADLKTCSGETVVTYNLGIGFKSLLKDLMVLDLALHHEPDMVVWFVTLETFTNNRQLTPPFVSQNPDQVRYLRHKYNLDLTLGKKFAPSTIWDKTLVGQRSHLADLVDFNLSAFEWAATGIDRAGRKSDPPSHDLPGSTVFNGWEGSVLDETLLRFDIFDTFVNAAGNVPVIVVNEPIFIGTGKNSDIRYNFNYPQWAFDQYRQMMLSRSQNNGWSYLDLWDVVPAENFTNSTFHRDAAGEKIVFQRLAPLILDLACP